MKISSGLLIVLMLVLAAQSEVVAVTSILPPIDLPGVEYATYFTSNPRLAPEKIETISDTIAKAAYSVAAKVDTYTLATNFFNSQRYFGDVCNRCKKLEYLSFRQGT